MPANPANIGVKNIEVAITPIHLATKMKILLFKFIFNFFLYCLRCPF